MTKNEKVKALQQVQNGLAKIKNINPSKYVAIYPGNPFPKPVFMIDGRGVRVGLFTSKLINDDSVVFTIEEIRKN